MKGFQWTGGKGDLFTPGKVYERFKGNRVRCNLGSLYATAGSSNWKTVTYILGMKCLSNRFNFCVKGDVFPCNKYGNFTNPETTEPYYRTPTATLNDSNSNWRCVAIITTEEESQEVQPKKELPMSKPTIIIETNVTLVNNLQAKCYSPDDLMQLIITEQSNFDRLKAFPVDSKAVDALKLKHATNISKLVVILDAIEIT